MFEQILVSCKWNGQKHFLIAFIGEGEVINILNICDTGRKIQKKNWFALTTSNKKIGDI